MAIEVDTSVVRGGGEASQQLASDVNRALDYFDTHIDKAQSWVGGALMEWLLAEHRSFASNVESGLLRSKALMVATWGALEDVAQRFDDNEYSAQVSVRDLFADLDPSSAAVPIDADTARRSLDYPSPVGALITPESSLADPTFQVMWDVINWPDYLSLSNWARELVNLVIQTLSTGLDGRAGCLRVPRPESWRRLGQGRARGQRLRPYRGVLRTARRSPSERCYRRLRGLDERGGRRSRGRVLRGTRSGFGRAARCVW